MTDIHAKHRENMVPHRQTRQRGHGPFYACISKGEKGARSRECVCVTVGSEELQTM